MAPARELHALLLKGLNINRIMEQRGPQSPASWWQTKANVTEPCWTGKEIVYDNMSQSCKWSLWLMKQFGERIVLWQSLMFFTYLSSWVCTFHKGRGVRSLSKPNRLPGKLFPALRDLLGNSLTRTIVSYKIQNEKTVKLKWSLRNCHPLNINYI